MKHSLAAILAVGTLLGGNAASAHRIDEYLQATLVSVDGYRVHASMRLIPGTAVADSVIAEIDRNGDGIFSADEQRAYAERVVGDVSLAIDASDLQPKLESWSFPPPAQMREGLGEIHIDYAADLPPGGSNRVLVLANHHRSAGSVYLVNALVPQDPDIRIRAQKRDESQSRYELDYAQTPQVATATQAGSANAAGAGLGGAAFSDLFHLGLQHIAEGADHLLFLLVLLLPAPLLVVARRWAGPTTVRRSLLRILGIVTAFTVGHSITLAIAVIGGVSAPSRPVEVLIAISILISALHALRPLFAGKEAIVAAFFGLIHGLAFAETLARLGLTGWQRGAGLLAFNLGIETMQLVVVAAFLPSLMLLSRTRAYSMLRIGGALVAAAVSSAWFVERLCSVDTGVDAIVGLFASHAAAFAVGLFLIAAASRLLPDVRSSRPHARQAALGG